MHRLVEAYEKHTKLVESANDILDIFHEGKIAVIISIEGLHQTGNSASILRNYYRLGVRCATLAHNKSNLYAASAVRNSIEMLHVKTNLLTPIIMLDFNNFALGRPFCRRKGHDTRDESDRNVRNRVVRRIQHRLTNVE